MTNNDASTADDTEILSVADRVLLEFTNVLSEEEGFAEIAGRLKAILLDKPDMSEIALARAIFEVEQP